MRLKETLRQIDAMPVEARIELADKRVGQLWRYIVSVMQTHASNSIINYTDHLSQQVGRSFAAHAFNDFQHAMFCMELIKLSAVWDNADLAKFSIPTVIELVDSPVVLRQLYRKRLEQGRGSRAYENDELSPVALAEINRRFRLYEFRNVTASYRKQLRRGVCLGRTVMKSNRLKAIRDYRDRNVAHNLDPDDPKLMSKPYAAPKYGYERRLLATTCTVANGLNYIIRDASFSYDDSMKIAIRNAEYLWHSCRFENIH